jgi:hypothetical protein
MTNSEDGRTCSICLFPFTAKRHRPWDLGCGHCICEPCFKAGELLVCPVCRGPVNNPHPQFALLSYLDRAAVVHSHPVPGACCHTFLPMPSSARFLKHHPCRACPQTMTSIKPAQMMTMACSDGHARQCQRPGSPCHPLPQASLSAPRCKRTLSATTSPSHPASLGPPEPTRCPAALRAPSYTCWRWWHPSKHIGTGCYIL